MGEVMVIRFNCMMVRNDSGIVRLKEIGSKICVEYITLKQLYLIKNMNGKSCELKACGTWFDPQQDLCFHKRMGFK